MLCFQSLSFSILKLGRIFSWSWFPVFSVMDISFVPGLLCFLIFSLPRHRKQACGWRFLNRNLLEMLSFVLFLSSNIFLICFFFAVFAKDSSKFIADFTLFSISDSKNRCTSWNHFIHDSICFLSRIRMLTDMKNLTLPLYSSWSMIDSFLMRNVWARLMCLRNPWR